MSEYNVNSIKTIEFGEAASERIGMYLSADLEEAVFLGLREIISNAVDEYLQGYGKKIKIFINTQKQVFSVQDEGRGIPVGIRPDGTNSLVAALTLPHTGGKLDNEVYNSAIGTNGIGASIVTHTAEWLDVEVFRNDKVYNASFVHSKKGAVLDGEVRQKDFKSTLTGTTITYKPCESTYKGNKLNVDKLKEYLEELQYLTPKLRIELYVDNEHTPIVYYSENGFSDALKKDGRFHQSPLIYKDTVDNVQIEFALQWSKQGGIKYYANSLYMPDGGSFVTGFKTSLTKAFNNCAGTSFGGEVIRKYLNGFISIKVKVPQFSNQAKTSLANPEARAAVSTFTTNTIKDFFNKHPADLESIVKIIETEQKAEAAADRARKKILEASKEVEQNTKRKVFASDKLKDAEHLGQDSILLVVEGDSAAASMAVARDIKKYGILGLRGKPINCLSNDEEKIYQNEEIKLLLSAMNIMPGKYDPKKLRYGKIAICVDADADGYHIALLIMSALKYLAPQFLEENRLCWLRSPLYIVTNGKKESYYFTDEEFNAVRKTIKGVVQRAKGLGALSAQQARNSMFNTEFQRLDILEPDAASEELLERLMGEDVAPRKQFIFDKVDFSTIRE